MRGLFSEFYGILIERNTRNMGIAEPREARGRVPILNIKLLILENMLTI